IYCGALFICCMVCHGELYRLRPDPAYLTRFYLLIATGGALGGIFVGLIAPLVFTDYYEFQIGVLLCGLQFTLICATEPRGRLQNLPVSPQPAEMGVQEKAATWFGPGADQWR